MVSFFEKLKKGMGIEVPEEELEEGEKVEEAKASSPASLQGKSAIEERPTRRKKVPKAKKIKIEEKPVEMEIEKLELVKPEIKGEEVPVKRTEEEEKKWPEPEGQLAIDVYQTETELVIQSAIAGVKPEDLDISMERDIITIKGNRQKPFEEGGDYFTQECYWGPFSREVILPVEIDPNRAEATMKDGILTVRIPKILREKKRTIKVRM